MAQGKRQPLRKCAGCGLMKEKRELVRIVRDETGQVSIDETGRKNGRGVYVCRDGACLARAQKSKALERGLKCKVSPEIYEELRRRIGDG